MAKAYEITEEISNEIRTIRKIIKNKSEDIRLHAVKLRGVGKKNKKIAESLDVHEKVVSKWIKEYLQIKEYKDWWTRQKVETIKIWHLKTKQVLEELTSLSIAGATTSSDPAFPAHHIREYRHVFGAVERPLLGEKFFLIMPNCNTNNMSVFRYNEDIVILVCDEAVWHKSKNLEISGNIIMTHIPPYTLEMNPIE